ncbi:MAG TPA: YciI family protein, partial [Nitrolancea sp.]|nr:YciI family protein [Nitrolancea sp.]
MKFAVVFGYENQQRIAETRPAHRAYLATLQENGKLVTAGPFVDDSGALIIYEADSEDDVIEIIQHDPFHEAGIFSTYLIRPWKQ